jgi:hypothetical protein
MAGWVEPGWNTKKASIATQQSLGFKNAKEGFTNTQDTPNFRALTVNTDRYCRIAGSLNPESTDTAGRAELIGIYQKGYSGKSGIAAIKQYLTDMYDRAIDSTKDANVSDAKGGREDSWNKCFGIPLRDPVPRTNDRFDTAKDVGSTSVFVDIPPTVGALPVYCMGEVGVAGPKNPWQRIVPSWENNAPPPGNGVFWMWGAVHENSVRPGNEAFSFYYNFNNPGPTVTAKIAAGFDDYGYIVLNGTKYPSTNPNAAIGYEGFSKSITPLQVTIPSGINRLEIRCVNGACNNSAYSGGGCPSPAGVWLAITDSKGNIMVKTNCDGWTCNRFFYPAEVYQISNYIYKLSDAAPMCASLGASVATYDQLSEAQRAGANWCSTGWVADKGTRNAFYPITQDTMGGCGNGRAGVIDWIGDDGWFKVFWGGVPFGYNAAINCFGNKPDSNAWNKINPAINDGSKGTLKVKGGEVLPFNKNQSFPQYKWSRYSNGPSPAPPPAPPVPPPPPPPPAPAASSPVLRSTHIYSLHNATGFRYEYGWNLKIPKEDGTYNCKATSEDNTQYFTFICTVSPNTRISSFRTIDAKVQDTKGMDSPTIKTTTGLIGEPGVSLLPSAGPRDTTKYFAAQSNISLTERKFSLTCTKA